MDRLEVTLRIRLDRAGVRRRLKEAVESDTAFFILGMVHALLTSKYGDEHCTVEMESATGLDPAFVRSMNSFARRHKAALDALETYGEVYVEDRDLLEVFQALHDVVITPVGHRWRIVADEPPVDPATGQSVRRVN
ncbi:MAG: hypothetical protein ACOY93_01215 [Bacillota bacterium]